MKGLFLSLKKKFWKWYYKDNSLSFLEFGDIIWGKRYNDEIEKDKILEGHQNGPFVVVYKDRHYVYGLYCTSSPKNVKAFEHLYLEIENCFSNSNKDSFVKFPKLYPLTTYHYFYKIGILADEEKNKLKKMLNVNCEKKITRKLFFTICKGDIICYQEKLYYVYDLDEENYCCYPLNKDVKKARFLWRGSKYSLIFQQIKNIKYTEKVEFVDTLSKNKMDLIDNMCLKYKNDFIEKRVLDIGKLVESKHCLYYIYGINEGKYLAMRIYLDSEFMKGMQQVVIQGGVFYTDFSEKKFTGKVPLKIKRMASVIEIYNIKKSRDAYKKNNKIVNKGVSKKQRIAFAGFKVGVVILNKKSFKRYVIVERNLNQIKAINVESFKVKNWDVRYIGDAFCVFEKVSFLELKNYSLKVKEVKKNKINC